MVRGAEVVGDAAPGARVEVRLALKTNRKREIEYTTHTQADANGRYRLRLPYATQDAPGVVRVGSEYALVCGGPEVRLAIDDAAVLSGALVPGPPLDCR